MLSTLISFDRRAIRAATIPLVASAFIAACDTDRSVAPTATPAMPTAAAPIRSLGNTGTLVIKVVDDEDHQLAGSSFKVTGPSASVINVTDNDATDGDKTKGVIVLPGLQPGLYTGCEVTPPAGFALPSWNCHVSQIFAGSTTGMEKFVSNKLPRVQGGFIDAAGAKVGGGTVSLRDSVGTLLMTVTDNSTADKDPAPGQFTIVLPSPGKFSVCEIGFPAGYAPAPGSVMCHTFTAPWELAIGINPFVIYPAPSASWTVRDMWGSLIGPATFKITTGFITNTVVDNGAGDLDPIMGKMVVKLPKAAVYTVCESAAPVGYWPDANCHTVDATSGLAVSGGIFTNMYAQVPNTP